MANCQQVAETRMTCHSLSQLHLVTRQRIRTIQLVDCADFYRATLCVSAFFAVARCPSACPSVRPSVCPSVTLVHCIQTAEDIVKILCRLGSRIILVFCPSPVPILNSKGNPFSGGAKYKGLGKFCDFRLKWPPISETVRDRSMVAMKR